MWQYLTIEHSTPSLPWLNELGAAWWELATAIPYDVPFGTKYQTTFKRRRPGLLEWLRTLVGRRAA